MLKVTYNKFPVPSEVYLAQLYDLPVKENITSEGIQLCGSYQHPSFESAMSLMHIFFCPGVFVSVVFWTRSIH